MTEKIKIIYIKSTDECYVSKGYSHSYSYDTSGKILINGKAPETTWSQSWVKCKGVPEKIETIKYGEYINKRWELKDASFESLKYLKVFPYSEVTLRGDVYDGYIFTENFKEIAFMYELKKDKTEDTYEELEFEITKRLDLEKLMDKQGLMYPRYCERTREYRKTEFKTETLSTLYNMMYPEFIHHILPLKLTIKQTYTIIRDYIKVNINPEYAHITSDYDFCFTVKKRLLKESPLIIKTEIFKKTNVHIKPLDLKLKLKKLIMKYVLKCLPKVTVNTLL